MVLIPGSNLCFSKIKSGTVVLFLYWAEAKLQEDIGYSRKQLLSILSNDKESTLTEVLKISFLTYQPESTFGWQWNRTIARCRIRGPSKKQYNACVKIAFSTSISRCYSSWGISGHSHRQSFIAQVLFWQTNAKDYVNLHGSSKGLTWATCSRFLG